jgi:hypothetical protein
MTVVVPWHDVMSSNPKARLSYEFTVAGTSLDVRLTEGQPYAVGWAFLPPAELAAPIGRLPAREYELTFHWIRAFLPPPERDSAQRLDFTVLPSAGAALPLPSPGWAAGVALPFAVLCAALWPRRGAEGLGNRCHRPWRGTSKPALM